MITHDNAVLSGRRAQRLAGHRFFLRTANFLAGGTAHILALGIFVLHRGRIDNPMNTNDQTAPGATSPTGKMHRPFWLTDMPTWLMLTLVAIGLPRTILADLNIIAPESGVLYYFLALAPYTAWLVVAMVRETSKPIMDFLVLGMLYGLSLVVVHQALWNVGPGLGHQPPASAVSFAENFSPGFQDLAIRGYTIMIAMTIGIGSGLVVAIVAFAAKLVRSKRQKP